MSQLIPATLRAPQPTPAVQGAQRPAALRSGDDFARTLRQETGDRSSTTRSSERPSSRDDRSDTAQSARIDSRRADQRRSTSAPDTADAPGRPDATTSPETSPVAGGAVAPQPTPVVLTALLGVVGAPVDAGAPTGAVVDAAAPEPTLGHGQPAATAAVALTSATVVHGEMPLGAAPGAGLAASALTASAFAAAVLGAAGSGAPGGGTDLGAGNGRVPVAGDLSVTSSATDLSAPATTTRPGEIVAVTPALVPVAPGATGGAVVDAAPTAVAAVVTATQGDAAGGGTAGSGTGGAGGTPVAESVTPGGGPAPTSHAGAFAQTLSGLGGVERASATAATGSTAQASLAEQVRGPVLALRTAALGEHVLTLKVTPENLGPVQVRAHIGAEGIRIELVGATDAAREGLRNLLTDLRRDLAGTGMNASLSLGADSGPGGRAGQGTAADLGWNGDGSGRARSGPAAATTTREPLTTPAAPAAPTSSGAHGVDILT